MGSSVDRSSQTGEKYGGLIKHGGASARTTRLDLGVGQARIDRSSWVMP